MYTKYNTEYNTIHTALVNGKYFNIHDLSMMWRVMYCIWNVCSTAYALGQDNKYIKIFFSYIIIYRVEAMSYSFIVNISKYVNGANHSYANRKNLITQIDIFPYFSHLFLLFIFYLNFLTTHITWLEQLEWLLGHAQTTARIIIKQINKNNSKLQLYLYVLSILYKCHVFGFMCVNKCKVEWKCKNISFSPFGKKKKTN